LPKSKGGSFGKLKNSAESEHRSIKALRSSAPYVP
jgi:hypothetical protein